MENDLPKSKDDVNGQGLKKFDYNPNAVFHDKPVSYFGGYDAVKDHYQEFVEATGGKKWLNSLLIIIIFLLAEAFIIANNSPTKDFVVDFFKIRFMH